MSRLSQAGLSFGLLLLGTTAACGEPADPQTRHCTALLEQLLRSPSTLKVIEASAFDSRGERFVSIEFDAANAYGTPIREKISCVYLPYNPSDPDALTPHRVSMGGRPVADFGWASYQAAQRIRK